ncbi:hypothetical protein C6500_15630 [Candidatus Poribacteria bacterium]|nr:MAG: hypothetical protein C6500_15630 [Candidatus Poribacteria bacterium]
MKNNLTTRIDTYYKLNTHLIYLDNERLNFLFDGEWNTRGWGVNHVIKFGKSKVFVKRIPLTELEYNHMFSTKNLYDLPTYYNYGVGSAGFGVFRELLTHIRTTHWVLQGAIENFPLMYHYRIMPRSGTRVDLDMKWYNRYVKYWNSNENIGRYMVDRTNAEYEVVLFLEYIPYIFSKWFEKNIDQSRALINEIPDTITFLRKNGIIHFDVHFNNILTDGNKPYLTDFGLVLDRRFDLNETERAFHKKHTHYDYGEFLLCFGEHLMSVYQELAETKKKKIMQKYGLKTEMQHHECFMVLLENIGEICAERLMKLDENYVEVVIKYRDIIVLMAKFFADMARNNRKDTKYSHAKLRRLLGETDILYGKTS